MNNLNFDDCVSELIEDIKSDYLDYCKENDMMDYYEDKGGLIVEPAGGRKYLKIVNSDVGGKHKYVWGFIVVNDTAKFKSGDILQSASWASPKTNHARGNVFTDYVITWKGALYMGDKRMVTG